MSGASFHPGEPWPGRFLCLRLGRGSIGACQGCMCAWPAQTTAIGLARSITSTLETKVVGRSRSAQEWLVVPQPPVTFRRAQGLLPLPMPVRGGSIGRLRRYVNLGEADFRLLVAWIAAALQPEGPYPVLALHGEQGSAKSTLARVIRLLVDPQAPPVLAQPKSTRNLMVTACGGWLLAYDNISTLASWLSDSFCQLSTGGGFAGRALFTDDERTLVFAQRPVILNGIDEFVRRDDLADRCVFLHLPTISPTYRRAEVEFWQSFRADYPVILGGLLDAIVWGMHELESLELEALPRMADFAAGRSDRAWSGVAAWDFS